MTEEKQGMKEINEIVDALELTIDTAAEVLEDGKINLSDLPAALTLVNNYKVYVNAVDNAGEVVAEAKDIDETEALALGMRVFAIIKKTAATIKEARK